MMRLKRTLICIEPPIREEWIDWQKRSLGAAKSEILNHGACIVECLLKERKSWAGHIARFGTSGKPEHILKHVLMWRNSWWWNQQKFFNELGPPYVKLAHPTEVGILRRWEWSLPRDWLLKYIHNRDSWHSSGSMHTAGIHDAAPDAAQSR